MRGDGGREKDGRDDHRCTDMVDPGDARPRTRRVSTGPANQQAIRPARTAARRSDRGRSGIRRTTTRSPSSRLGRTPGSSHRRRPQSTPASPEGAADQRHSGVATSARQASETTIRLNHFLLWVPGAEGTMARAGNPWSSDRSAPLTRKAMSDDRSAVCEAERATVALPSIVSRRVVPGLVIPARRADRPGARRSSVASWTSPRCRRWAARRS